MHRKSPKIISSTESNLHKNFFADVNIASHSKNKAKFMFWSDHGTGGLWGGTKVSCQLSSHDSNRYRINEPVFM